MQKMSRTRPEIDQAKVRKTRGRVELDLKPITELPSVSILTITKDRSTFFALPLRNWRNFKYPENSIEWIIVDDSKTDDIRQLLPDDERIHYFHLPVPLPVADKRNYAVKKCKGEIIVNMDDDDFYFDDSVISKVRILIDYPDKDCVYSLPLGIHDLISNKSAIVDSEGDDIPEATLAYRKSFWKTGKFGGSGRKSEWYGFCSGRWDKMINIPFWFNMVATTHTKNATGGTRRLIKSPENIPSFHQVWGDETSGIIRGISAHVKSELKKQKGK